ncbi:MAG: penicillin acylase family protein, partial [Methylococcales bacterium]
MLRKAFVSILFTILAGLIIVSSWAAYNLYDSQPQRSGEVRVAGLNSPVTVRFDRFGVPEILAKNRIDAAFALGYVTAGDRLFQMDLIRRKTAGKLAEIFSAVALESDIAQRHLNLEGAAWSIVQALPSEQREALEAYAKGVNSYLEQASNLPPEFWVLRYEPEKWSPPDSILVVLSMFQLLTWTESDERMLSVMHECLPNEVAAFLSPDTDRYTKILTGGSDSFRPIQDIPAEQLAALLEQNRASPVAVRVKAADTAYGSNNWAVNRLKTRDGVAILANDMHLPVSIPNTWYRATLRYDGLSVSGLNLPGVPSIVVGSNGKIAWGFTNFMADVLDLVKLKIHPEDPNQYLSSSGWRTFERVPQSISVKGANAVAIETRMTEWGPVSPQTLLGQFVVIHWSALDPEIANLSLMDLDQVSTIEQAMALLNRAGAPPQNVLLADDRGNIAWTLMGRFPKRS